MDFIFNYIDFLIHFDRHLGGILQQYGTYTYAILFLIIFCETGLVVTPFLPGDSLLFVVGTFAAREDLDRNTLLMLLPLAAIIGDNVNYWVGHFFGPRMAEKEEESLDPAGVPGPDPAFLREVRRQDGLSGQVPADHPDLCPLRGGHRKHDLPPLSLFRHHGGHHVGLRLRAGGLLLR